MMKSAQLAHGEYDKYIATNLKKQGDLHWTSPLPFSRVSDFQFNQMEHKQFCRFSLRIRAEF